MIAKKKAGLPARPSPAIKYKPLDARSVEGVALVSKHRFFASIKRRPAGATAGGDRLGASNGGGSCKKLVQLSFGKSVGKNESPVLHATGAKHDGRKDFIDCSCGLHAAHVGAGAKGAGDGHGRRRLWEESRGGQRGDYDRTSDLDAMERRTWDTPIRERWNPIISSCLKAIDLHNELYFQTSDKWHIAKAQELREYVAELKNRLTAKESEASTI